MSRFLSWPGSRGDPFGLSELPPMVMLVRQRPARALVPCARQGGRIGVTLGASLKKYVVRERLFHDKADDLGHVPDHHAMRRSAREGHAIAVA